jgi:AcrR family transcriptional regulator
MSDRPTADERREQVIEAAIHEFAEFGYHAAKTAAIAKRARISQPYIYALFPDKKALFLACQLQVREQIRAAFTAAFRRSKSIEGTLAGMAQRYRAELTNPDAPRCQLQGYAACADPDIREFMRSGYLEIFEMVGKATGADEATVARFMATGMLLNLGAVLDLPDTYVSAFPSAY